MQAKNVSYSSLSLFTVTYPKLSTVYMCMWIIIIIRSTSTSTKLMYFHELSHSVSSSWLPSMDYADSVTDVQYTSRRLQLCTWCTCTCMLLKAVHAVHVLWNTAVRTERNKQMQDFSGMLQTEVNRLFIKSVPGSLMVLVIADLVCYPFMYYPSKFVCKSGCFVRDRRNLICYPILCIIRTRIQRTRHVLEILQFPQNAMSRCWISRAFFK